MNVQAGMSGGAVSNLQKNLTQLGLSPLKVDGSFGPQTLAALKAFQLSHSLKPDGVAGQDTQKAIAKSLIAQIPKPADGPTPWLSWMRNHIGAIEKTGSTATPFDNEVFSYTNYGPLHGTMESGCAATACAALEENGYKSSHSAAAESFRDFGTPCELKPGAIVGFNWAGKPDERADHVTFCDHVVDGKYVACLGGNQSHEVQVSVYSRSCIAFIRWPLEKLPAPPLPGAEVHE